MMKAAFYRSTHDCSLGQGGCAAAVGYEHAGSCQDSHSTLQVNQVISWGI